MGSQTSARTRAGERGAPPDEVSRDRRDRRDLAAALVGTPRLVRLALRRDRVVLPVWIAVIVGLTVASVASVVALYETEADRMAYAMVAASSAVARAFDGPMTGTSAGAITVTETFGVLAILIGIMSVQAVVRHTRQEEETGRAELLGSTVVGRHAPLLAGGVIACGANLLVGVGVTLTFAAFGLPLVGSVAVGLALAGVGICFAAVAAMAAQVAGTQRGANGIGATAVGVAFLLRAVGDAAGEVTASGVEVVSAWPSWLSPIGWGQQLRAFADERWWVLSLFVAFAVLATAAAVALTVRRDVGAGLIEPRRGPPAASRWLRSPLGLAFRLHRGAWLGWTAGLAVIAAAFGAIGEEAGEILATSEELAAALGALGEAGLIDLFFTFAFGVLAVVTGAFTVQALLRARGEEAGGRAEPLLATATSRARWLGSHVVLAVAGAVAILVLVGLSAGLSYVAATGETERVGELLLAALVQVPAVLALAGFVVAAVGIARGAAVALGWGAVVLSFVMGQLGALFELPQWLLNVSPFTHTPGVPADDVTLAPILILLAVAAGLTVVGFLAMRRRDLDIAP